MKSALLTQTTSPLSQAIARAIELFLDRYPNIAIIEIEATHSNSYQQWIAEVEGADETHGYEIKVGADQLDLLEDKQFLLPPHRQDARKHRRSLIELDDLLPFDEIVRIAQDAKPDGQALEYELEREGAVMEWEVIVQVGQEKYEIEIDGETGTVLEIERD